MVKPRPIVPCNFVDYCATLIPTVFDDSMSYYEALCHLMKIVQANSEITNKYIDEVEALDKYVKTYFDNLDVQEEINNKLDEMVSAGTLQEIMATYLEANTAWCFDSVSAMKSASNLIAGSYAQTTGFYAANDGGKALYKIREANISETADEMFTIAVGDLIAELIIPSELAPEAVGVAGDGITDCTETMQALLTYAGTTGIKIKGTGTYLISDSLTIPNVNHYYLKLKTVDATALTNKPAFIVDHTRYGEIEVDVVKFTKGTAIDVHAQASYQCAFILKGTSYVSVKVKYVENAQTAFVLHSIGRSATEGCYYNTLSCAKADTFNLLHMYANNGAVNGNRLENTLHIISSWTNTSSAVAYSIINDAYSSTSPVYQNNHNDIDGLMVEKYNNDGTSYMVADLSNASNTFINVDRIEVHPALDTTAVITTNSNTSYNQVKICSGWYVIPLANTRFGNNNYVCTFNNYKNSLNNTLYVNSGGATIKTTNFTAVTNSVCDGTVTYNPATGMVRINGLFTNLSNLSADTNYEFATFGLNGRTYSHGLVYLATSGNPTSMTQIGTVRRVRNQTYCYLRVDQTVAANSYLFVDFMAEE